MQAKRRFWIVTLALLSLLAFFAPQQAWAAPDPSNIPTGGDAPLQADADCEAVRGSANDPNAAYFTNKAAHLQRQQASIQALHTLYPVANALSTCVQNIMSIMQKTPMLASPTGIAGAIVSALIVGIVNQVCSQVMGTITSVQPSLTNLVKICIPLPKFNGLDLPKWNQPACSGGNLTISPITGWSAPSSVITTANPHLN